MCSVRPGPPTNAREQTSGPVQAGPLIAVRPHVICLGYPPWEREEG